MFKYRFPCPDIESTRAVFENMMLNDAPYGKGVFGINLWRKGLHITECSSSISGFYIPEHEVDSTRGSPIRVSFCGKFIKDGDDTFFEVCIYPRIIEISLIVFVYISSAYCISEPIGAFFLTFIFMAFLFGYYMNIKEAAEIFKVLMR